MLKLLLSLSFFIGEPAIAQDHWPIHFDKFINKSNIEWAAWRIDTVHFTNVNLNERVFPTAALKIVF